MQAPLNITPRTRRIANVFGLIDDRVLKFTDANSGVTDSSDYNHLRVNFSQLLAKHGKASLTSCVANLGVRKQFVLALDGPGVPPDPFAYPLTWSRRNQIAVACGKDVYFQDLDSRLITHLCKITKTTQGRPTSVQWCDESPLEIAVGTTLGSIQLWDASVGGAVREWRDEGWDAVGGMDWRGSVLAVGLDGGAIEFYDTRTDDSASRLDLHRSKVHGVKFSPDGNYLATSDQQGIVYLWDVRAGKPLTDCRKMGGRIKHGAPVKVRLTSVLRHSAANPRPRHSPGAPGSPTCSRQARRTQTARSASSAPRPRRRSRTRCTCCRCTRRSRACSGRRTQRSC